MVVVGLGVVAVDSIVVVADIAAPQVAACLAESDAHLTMCLLFRVAARHLAAVEAGEVLGPAAVEAEVAVAAVVADADRTPYAHQYQWEPEAWRKVLALVSHCAAVAAATSGQRPYVLRHQTPLLNAPPG